MKVTLNITHTIFSPLSKAYQVATEMQADDEDWVYIVVPNPVLGGPDTAIIKVYDEDGVYVETV